MRYLSLLSLLAIAGCVGSPCRHCSAADPVPCQCGPNCPADCDCGCKVVLAKLDEPAAKPAIVNRTQKVLSGRTGLPADGWEKNEPDDGDYGYWKEGVLLMRYCPKFAIYKSYLGDGQYGPAVPCFDKYTAPAVSYQSFGGGCSSCAGGRCK